MSLTRKKKLSSEHTPQRNRNTVPSIISSDVTVAGDIDTGADIHTDGQHQGNVRCATLTVGEAARIEGSITADVVEVAGHIHGDVVTRLIEVRNTGMIHGNVVYQEVRIDLGGRISGSLTCDSEAAKPQGKSVFPAQPASAQSTPTLRPIDNDHAKKAHTGDKPPSSTVGNVSQTA